MKIVKTLRKENQDNLRLVHMCDANARNVRYADAVEVFFQDGGQVTLCLLAFALTFALAMCHTRSKRKPGARKWLILLSLRLRLRCANSRVFFLVFVFASVVR